MRITKKLLSILLTIAMVVALLPVITIATGTEEDVVYLSVTYEGEYLPNIQGGTIMNVPVALADIAAVNLDDYGLSNMWYEKADPDEDGNYEPTALQLIIYAHENFYGGSWDEVSFDAAPGSSYFQGGVFGFTQNLIYFLNGKFPVDRDMTDALPDGSSMENIGATSDHIILKAGDRIDMTSFSCWSFYLDDAGGFDVFVDDDGEFVYDFTAVKNQALSLNLKQSFCDLMSGRIWDAILADIEVFYGKTYGSAEGSVYTDAYGKASITFAEAGSYYLWTESRRGTTDDAHTWCEGPMMTGENCYVSTPVVAKVTVTNQNTPAPEQPRQPQDVSAILDATMAKLAATVTEPTFGTMAGEWTVFSLARGGYFAKDSKYFSDYYDRIVEIVNTKAAEQNKNGALDTISTENSRLIVALSAIGKDATSVGNWNLIEPYSANGLSWIGRQGINGVMWSLIALDSNNYETETADLRQTLVDNLLSLQHNDGGWSLYPQADVDSNVDITGMTLVALYPYRNQPAVAAACEEAIAFLSNAQQSDGGFAYDENASGTVESCAWAIVAATTWGINPDTDPRFIKNGHSAVDNLLAYYLEDTAEFEHVIGGGANAMATDQACYALVAYDRFINSKTALYDYSDVTFGEDTAVSGKPTASLGLPAQITDDVGKTFNAVITLDQWDNAAGYKLIDVIVNVPNGLSVTDVTTTRVSGGDISYHLDGNKLRIVYFDANSNNDITVTGSAEGNAFPAQFFTITFRVDDAEAGDKLNMNIEQMSIKLSSDSEDEDAMVNIDVQTATGTVDVIQGISYSAICLYTGDGIDLIPANKKAVAISVVGMDNVSKLIYNDGTNEYTFKYSTEISEKTGIDTYVALVDASIAMEQFENKLNVTFTTEAVDEIVFGDANGDGVINAQDALAAVDTWLRKGDAPTDDKILVLNVNSDARINTFDALGIVEKFVNGSDFGVVTKAATLTTNP